jgi:hypothetical protein
VVFSLLINKDGNKMKFWSALLKAFLHALATLVAMIAVWAAWAGWIAFINHRGGEVYTPWETYRFAMIITLTITLILAGGFFILSLIYHYFSANISRQQYIFSSLTLAFSSLLLWLVLPQGGMPVILLLVGLPILSSLWMLGSKQSLQVA